MAFESSRTTVKRLEQSVCALYGASWTRTISAQRIRLLLPDPHLKQPAWHQRLWIYRLFLNKMWNT